VTELRNAEFTGDCVAVAESSRDSRVDVTVSEALRNRGVPEPEARFFEDEYRNGSNLVSVRADGRRAEAEAILRRHGGRFGSDTPTAAAKHAVAASPIVGGAPTTATGPQWTALADEELVPSKEHLPTRERAVTRPGCR
jgi:hypothetical protein